MLKNNSTNALKLFLSYPFPHGTAFIVLQVKYIDTEPINDDIYYISWITCINTVVHNVLAKMVLIMSASCNKSYGCGRYRYVF